MIVDVVGDLNRWEDRKGSQVEKVQEVKEAEGDDEKERDVPEDSPPLGDELLALVEEDFVHPEGLTVEDDLEEGQEEVDQHDDSHKHFSDQILLGVEVEDDSQDDFPDDGEEESEVHGRAGAAPHQEVGDDGEQQGGPQYHVVPVVLEEEEVAVGYSVLQAQVIQHQLALGHADVSAYPHCCPRVRRTGREAYSVSLVYSIGTIVGVLVKFRKGCPGKS